MRAFAVERPDGFSAADAYAVISGVQIQIAVVAGLDVTAALGGGDRPSVAVAAGGLDPGAVGGDGHISHSQRLTPCSRLGGGQQPRCAVLGHGNGDGVGLCDIRPFDLFPCRRSFCREHLHRQQGKQHQQRQQHGCQPAAESSFLQNGDPPLFMNVVWLPLPPEPACLYRQQNRPTRRGCGQTTVHCRRCRHFGQLPARPDGRPRGYWKQKRAVHIDEPIITYVSK